MAVRVRVAVQALRVSEHLLLWVTEENGVLTQELALTAIIVPCLQQRADNTCIDFKRGFERRRRRSSQNSNMLNLARVRWFVVRFAQKTTRFLGAAK